MVNLGRNAGNLNRRTNAIAGGRRIENHARLGSRLRPHSLLVCFLVYPGKFVTLVGWVVRLLY
jgi:hypothetical protein